MLGVGGGWRGEGRRGQEGGGGRVVGGGGGRVSRWPGLARVGMAAKPSINTTKGIPVCR